MPASLPILPPDRKFGTFTQASAGPLGGGRGRTVRAVWIEPQSTKPQRISLHFRLPGDY